MTNSEGLLPEFDAENASTRKVLERCPEDKFGWKPHGKSMTLGKLASHLAGMSNWGTMTITTDELNFEPGQYAEGPPDTIAELLAKFDEESRIFREKLANVTDEELQKPWALKMSGNVIFSLPKATVLRTFVFNHAVHHRAQVGVYLRLLEIAVPAIYGPTADEQA